MPTLVLWDVDGTLVEAGTLAREVFADAFRAVTGRPAAALEAGMVATAGRTDTEIALEVLALHGVADGERHLGAYAEALAAALAARVELIRQRGRALPGAAAALWALAASPGVVQSLLTGNIEPNARLKLAAFGLGRGVDFDVGAYGSDDGHRPNLVEVARRKAAAKYGIAFGPASTVLIGDTPLDVLAGREGGARVVAVASGRSTVAELRAAGADAVLADLVDTDALLRAVLAP